MHYLLCLLFILTTSLNALIVETSSFKEITSYTNEETLVLLDIDDTLLLPVQMLGSDEWFLRHMQDIENKGLTKHLALERCIADWEAIRHITKMRVVEEGTEQIVSKMQEEGVSIMALTTQGMALATRTVQQLADAGFNLLRTAPCADDFYIALAHHGVLYRKGVLFTSGTDKGAALFHFLDSIHYTPARIVFINDKASHLKEVENTALKRGVEFIGLRYAFADIHKAAFNYDIAKFQFTHSSFDRILSDEEAEKELAAQLLGF